MNETDQLVRELYTADSPSPPAPEVLWASVESKIGAPADSSRVRRRRHRTRFALAFGLALAAAVALALLPALRHSPSGAIPENASAAEVLRTLAGRGSSLPDVPRGSFLYTAGTRITLSGGPNDDGIYFDAFIRQHWQLWVGRDGSVRQRVRTEPKYVGYPTPRDRRLARRSPGPETFPEDWTTHSRTEFRKDFGMTLRAMRHLPTDASALARAVLANPFAHERSSSKSGLGLVDDAFEGALTILRTPVRPAVRAAMYGALATLPHVRRLPDESVGAKPAVAVALRFALPGKRHDLCDHVLLLDPKTGALLGSRYVYLFPTAGLPAGTAINRWTYRQAVVPTLRRGPLGR
jgi:hypothetical protein